MSGVAPVVCYTMFDDIPNRMFEINLNTSYADLQSVVDMKYNGKVDIKYIDDEE